MKLVYKCLCFTDVSLPWYSIWSERVSWPWDPCEWTALWRQVSAGKFCVLPLWWWLCEDSGFWIYHVHPARWKRSLELYCPSLWRWACDPVLQRPTDSREPSQAPLTKTQKVAQMGEFFFSKVVTWMSKTRALVKVGPFGRYKKEYWASQPRILWLLMFWGTLGLQTIIAYGFTPTRCFSMCLFFGSFPW